LNGKIDRLEKKDNIYRIIDYKTSNCELRKIPEKNQEVYFENLISKTAYKYTFQAIFYSFLFLKSHNGYKVNPGLYNIKDSNKALGFVKDKFLENDEINAFEEKLIQVFNGLFDAEKDFSQTEDIANCTYCDFKSICYRE
jgi:ATP-dependent helicase/DNAse subunit B